MIKVVIADDEDKICQLIYKLVDWNSLDMDVVGIAHNGLEALELVKIHIPDIVITDIRMPGYNGLEFIEKVKEINFLIDFIIISGYQHFEYAQKAIKFGVSDYLLKPIKKDELHNTLVRMRDNFLLRAEQISNEEKMKINLKNNIVKLRAEFFSGVLFQRRKIKEYSMDTINLEYKYNFKEGLFQVVAIKIDGIDKYYFSNIKFLQEKIYQIIEYNLNEYCYDFESLFENNICYIILNFCEENKKQVRKQAKCILAEILLQKDILGDVECTIGLGITEEDIQNINISLRTAIYAYEQRLVFGTNRVIENDFSKETCISDSSDFFEFNKKFNSALDRLNVNDTTMAIYFLKEKIKKGPHTSGHEILQITKEICNIYLFNMRNNKIILDKSNSFFEDFSSGVNNYGSINKLFDYLNLKIISSLEKVIEDKKQMDTKPIREAKQYMQDNFKSSISLDEVSHRVGFNASYFSVLFKKDTGYTFLEYLSEIRMNKAKDLLKETNYSIANICREVGYSDVKYFTKVFTKYTGLRPNAYRKLYS